MDPVISVEGLSKTYAGGFQALKSVDLTIRRGEIFALLGPNGAGKTTLISIVCGIVNPTIGSVTVDGHDIRNNYRAARAKIGLVPQELTTDAFESVWNTVSFSRGLFGKRPNPAHIERVLKDLSLHDKRNDKIMTLSGGMKRRVMIAKALSHEPEILFLDEPSAGVGMMSKGELILVEEKTTLMRKLGKKQLTLELSAPLDAVPPAVAAYDITLANAGRDPVYTYDTKAERTGITTLLEELKRAGVRFKDLRTTQSSLEDIFVDLTSR